MHKYLLSLSFVFILLSCSQTANIQRVQDMEAQGGAFDKFLRQGYLDLATIENDLMNTDRTKFFIARAELSSQGKSPAPAMFQSYGLTGKMFENASSSYGRLKTAFDGGAKIRLPEQSAKAQALYECTLQEAEDYTTDEPCLYTRCAGGLKKVLNVLEGKGKGTSSPLLSEIMCMTEGKEGCGAKKTAASSNAPAPAPLAVSVPEAPVKKKARPDPKQAYAKIGDVYVVYFGFDKSSIPAAADEFIKELAGDYRTQMPEAVNVRGYTDTVGSSAYNLALSKRRAKMVANALNKEGVPKERMKVEGFGKGGLAIQTGDEVAEVRNRRVEVTMENPLGGTPAPEPTSEPAPEPAAPAVEDTTASTPEAAPIGGEATTDNPFPFEFN